MGSVGKLHSGYFLINGVYKCGHVTFPRNTFGCAILTKNLNLYTSYKS